MRGRVHQISRAARSIDLAAVKICMCNFFKALSSDIEKRDMAALANAATLKRDIDALQAMVTLVL
jgi:hypothetical protein